MARVQTKNTKNYAKGKVCIFCQEGIVPDYKDVVRMRRFLSDRARIVGARRTATCSRHQRQLTVEVKRARYLALLPYTVQI